MTIKFNPAELFDLFGKIENTDLYIKRLEGMMIELGFDFWAYGVRPSIQEFNKQPAIINNYSETWNEIYKKRNYFKVDPIVRHGIRSTELLFWGEDNFKNTPQFWEEANSFSIKQGVSLPHRDTLNRISMLTFVSTEIMHDEESIRCITPLLLCLAQINHQKLSSELIISKIDTEDIFLTIREKDVLNWSSAGFTSSEIAYRLNISESTVKYHIANILKKLAVPNKVAAITKALKLNLLD